MKANKRSTIAVMDYSTGIIYIYTHVAVDTLNIEEVEKFVESKGHRMSESYYMTGDAIGLSINGEEEDLF